MAVILAEVERLAPAHAIAFSVVVHKQGYSTPSYESSLSPPAHPPAAHTYFGNGNGGDHFPAPPPTSGIWDVSLANQNGALSLELLQAVNHISSLPMTPPGTPGPHQEHGHSHASTSHAPQNGHQSHLGWLQQAWTSQTAHLQSQAGFYPASSRSSSVSSIGGHQPYDSNPAPHQYSPQQHHFTPTQLGQHSHSQAHPASAQTSNFHVVEPQPQPIPMHVSANEHDSFTSRSLPIQHEQPQPIALQPQAAYLHAHAAHRPITFGARSHRFNPYASATRHLPPAQAQPPPHALHQQPAHIYAPSAASQSLLGQQQYPQPPILPYHVNAHHPPLTSSGLARRQSL